MIEIEALRSLSALKGYDDRELAVLLGSSTEREYAPGEVILEAGQRGRSCILVVSGEVEVQRPSADAPQRMRRYGAGMFLGQISLVDGRPHTSTSRAVTRVVSLEFTRDVFEALLRARSPLALHFQRQIAASGIRTLRLATARLLELLTAETREPVAGESPASAPPPANTKDMLRYIQTTVDEWGIPLDDVAVKRADRVPTQPYPSRPPKRG